jgi:prepilin-type processing-associated H-X9-DG protein
MRPATVAPHGTLVLVNSANLQADLEQLLKSSGATISEQKLNGADRVSTIRFRGPVDPEAPVIQFIRRGSHLAIQVGERTAAGAVEDPLQSKTLGPGQPLASVSIDLKGFYAQFSEKQFPIQATPDDKRTFMIAEVLQILGLDGMQSYVAQAGFDDTRCWSESQLAHNGPRRGLLTLWNGAPFTLKDLPPLPESSASFYVGSVDWSQFHEAIWESALQLADKFGPPDAREGLIRDRAKFEDRLGFRIKEDLLDTLGPWHALYSDSSNAFAGIGAGLVFQVRDAATLRRSIEELVRQFPQGPGTPRVVRTKKYGRELISIGQQGVPIWPTVCIDKDWLIVALTPQMVESFLLRVDGKLPSWQPDESTKVALKALPPAMLSLTVSNPRPMLVGMNQYASLLQTVAPDAPLLDLPPVDLVTKPLFPNVAVCSIEDGQIVWSSRDALPTIPGIGSFNGPSMGSSAVLVALLLPAVQQAREAARRTQSMNNLKQIGLALHNYHDVYSHFPAGTVVNSATKPEDRLSWQAEVLPFIEQAPLHNQLNFKKGWQEQPEALIRVKLPVYTNPSLPPMAGFEFGETTDYVGIAGLGVDGPKKKPNEKGAGLFAYDSPRHIRDILDGTSNTLMVGGVTANRGRWAQGGPSTIRPFTKQPYMRGPDGFSGIHTGGTHFSFADGSVRFISDNIDPKTLEALVTIQGGEVVPDF